tara:strand:- start:795 stop:1004 length:210 start_codon:yes stop_codon:yes gene_type:complete
MELFIFTIGTIIFLTYMFFLIRMINKSHKSQEMAQGKYNYKKQINPTNTRKNKKIVGRKITSMREEWDL